MTSSTVPTDVEILEWIARNLFERKWEGTLGEPSHWYIRGDFRHTTQHLRGENIREAVIAAMASTEAAKVGNHD